MWTECYDYATAHRWFFWPLLIGLPICVGCLVTLVDVIKKKSEKGCSVVGLYLFAGFSLFWEIGVGCDLISTNLKYNRMLSDHQYAEVEGPIEHFRSNWSKKWYAYYDTFSVAQVRVIVKTKKVRAIPEITTAADPLANGQWVKVYYAIPAATDSSAEAKAQRVWMVHKAYTPEILAIWVRREGDKQ